MRRCFRQFIHALSHLVRLSPPMPMSAKPPTGTRIVIVTMIFGAALLVITAVRSVREWKQDAQNEQEEHTDE